MSWVLGANDTRSSVRDGIAYIDLSWEYLLDLGPFLRIFTAAIYNGPLTDSTDEAALN